MNVTLACGADTLDTLTIAVDGSPTELALVVDVDGPRAIVERGAGLGLCVSLERSPSRAAVRDRVAAWGRQCACSGSQEPQ